MDGRAVYASREDGLLILHNSHKQARLSATQVGKLFDFVVDMFFPGG